MRQTFCIEMKPRSNFILLRDFLGEKLVPGWLVSELSIEIYYLTMNDHNSLSAI